MRLDSAARLEIARQGMDADSVPADGQRVLVQRSGNVAFDVTDKVHPSVAATVTLAARIVGLDIAGVDLWPRTSRGRWTSSAAPSSKSTPAPAC